MLTIFPCLENDNIKIYSAGLSEVSGFMDLNMDVITISSDYIDISLSHYFKQNGDSILDPDMTLRVFKDQYLVFPLSYQDQFKNQEIKIHTAINDKITLSKFLSIWLDNLRIQKHIIKEFS